MNAESVLKLDDLVVIIVSKSPRLLFHLISPLFFLLETLGCCLTYLHYQPTIKHKEFP